MKKGKLRKLFTCIDAKYSLKAKRSMGQAKETIALKFGFYQSKKISLAKISKMNDFCGY